MIAVTPPILNPAFSPDEGALRLTTIHFDYFPGEANPTLYAPNRWEYDNGIDERTKIVYPASRLRHDDMGRQVADINYKGPGPREDFDWLL